MTRPNHAVLIERLRDVPDEPALFKWLADDQIEGTIAFDLRHKSGAKAHDYLTQFLLITRQFAYATQDDSWGELEKELKIIIRRMVIAERRQREAAAALAAADKEIERLRGLVREARGIISEVQGSMPLGDWLDSAAALLGEKSDG